MLAKLSQGEINTLGSDLISRAMRVACPVAHSKVVKGLADRQEAWRAILGSIKFSLPKWSSCRFCAKLLTPPRLPPMRAPPGNVNSVSMPPLVFLYVSKKFAGE